MHELPINQSNAHIKCAETDEISSRFVKPVRGNQNSGYSRFDTWQLMSLELHMHTCLFVTLLRSHAIEASRVIYSVLLSKITFSLTIQIASF